MMIKIKMVQRAVEGFTLLLTLLAKVVLRHKPRPRSQPQPHSMHMSMQQMISNSDHKSMEESKVELEVEVEVDDSYSLSWRLAVEANNVRPFRTVPVECYKHVENYMTGGQYEQDLNLITHQILGYAFEIPQAGDGFDAWIFDVDDTCISNISYYEAKRFGCDPFDSAKFKAWITKGACPAIPMVLVLFNKLRERGFKVFLLTGRDEATLRKITTDNLRNQGFIGYERLILRSAEYKGQSAVRYKSQIRKQIEGEGYRIWGNVGDQWSDLQGECLGNRTFKLPNPMYFIS